MQAPLEHWHFDQLLACRSLFSIDSQEDSHYFGGVGGKVARDLLVLPVCNTRVELVHRLCREGQLQREHLVEAAPQGPYVGLLAVHFVFPDLRAGIARRPSLRLIHLVLEDLANV